MSSRTQPPERGTLYVVATPIGNLGDISARARQVLGDVTVIAAEDTRHTGNLLQHLGIAKPMVSLHEHNEAQRAAELLERLNRGEDVALVSDAGTPLISDPGFDVVRTVVAAGARALPIPGACAAIAALSVAGLPTDRFVFEGFLSAKTGARVTHLEALRTEPRTMVFYEAPHRVEDTLAAMAAVLGADRRGVVARELTKQYETVYHGTLAELAARAENDKDMGRGEIVIVVAGTTEAIETVKIDADKALRVLLEELPPAQAAKLAAKLTGAKRSELYDKAVSLTR
jgi:16S rRNA (cytidine1402-2'-O)-methyltransferase